MNIELENRIYLLQQTKLPTELARKVTKADIAYLQNRNDEAALLVSEVEKECKIQSIEIEKPFI